MSEAEYECSKTLERFNYFTAEQSCEPIVAAVLVLATALNDAGVAIANLTDSDGWLNMHMDGSVETSSDK